MASASEQQPLSSSSTAELYSHEVPSGSDPVFSHESSDVTGKSFNRDKTPWYIPPKRYVIALMTFLGFANLYALRVNLSVAIVAMTTNHSTYINGTLHTVSGPEFNWDQRLRGHILASFFYGYIFTQLPGGFLSNRYGGKYLFGVGVLVTALLTLLTPVFATWSYKVLIACRILEGLFEGVTYPAIHAIWSKWAPPAERTKLATFGFSGSYFGTVVSMVLSGALAESAAGWQSIFYVFGSIAIIWFLLWCIVVTESPAGHPGISTAELDYIQNSIGYTDEQTKRVHPPLLQIVRSAPVWAIAVAHFVENWGFYTWLTQLPTFMTHVLKFHMDQGGFLSALPYLVMGIVVFMGGYFADALRSQFGVPTIIVRKVFTCGAFALQAVFMVAAGYLMSRAAAVACLTVAVGIGGFAWAGFSVNHLDIAPQFASILMGLSNTFATLPGIVSPLLTSVIVVHEESSADWQIVFYLAACIYGIGGIVYGLLASGETQIWAQVPLGYRSYMDDPEEGQ
ncbi:sialin [Aplysia californica]|uniref:Sialin n=1 Tax=Aplysia californica TaxID=6500 RepID=A0ABM1ACC4_APLCA|nr:sialin [Aplysia californica]